VEQAVYDTHHLVEKKQITLTVDVEIPQGVLLFDSQQVEQVLLNLLENACKFTPAGGSITVRGRSIAGQVLAEAGLPQATAGYRIHISDTGRGIGPEQLERIFDEHASFGNPMDRSGWGLGLAICRMIIQAHKGRIWCDSGTQGSCFSFVLPVIQPVSNSNFSQIAI
jgi:two-component system clock-associated histidine kinase SasA